MLLHTKSADAAPDTSAAARNLNAGKALTIPQAAIRAAGTQEAQDTPGAPQSKWSNGMKLKSWLAGLAGAVTMGVAALPADAAPASGLTDRGTAAPTTDVQQANWYGRRHGYRYYYGYEPRWRHHHRHHGYRYYYGSRYHHRHDHRW